MERGNLCTMLREKSKWKHHKDLSTNVVHRGGFTRISDEGVERHWSEGVELSTMLYIIN